MPNPGSRADAEGSTKASASTTSLSRASNVRRALVVAAIMLASGVAAAQQGPSTFDAHKTLLEVHKLQLEVERLKAERASAPAWTVGILSGLLGAVVGALASVRAAHLGIFGALDQSVHEKRLELYPRLVNGTEQLALYFPPAKTLSPTQCRAMGEALRAWYFEGGGVFLSTKARDAYFRFMKALTRASLAKELNVPVFPEDAEKISAENVDNFKVELAQKLDLDGVDRWIFGSAGSDSLAYRFKDFVFLQRLSSNLRTTLAEDLRSRRRPAA